MAYTRRDFLQIGSGLLAGCAQRYFLVERENLTISEHPTYSVTYLSQKEGERQLQGLANGSSVEEEWLYFKSLQKEIGVWVDMGKVQEQGKVKINGGLLQDLLREFMKHNTAKAIVHCSHYHIHPLFSLQQKWGGVLSDNSLDILSLPSSPDILFDILLGSFLRQEGYVLDDSRVVGPRGMYVYKLTNSLRERFVRESDDFLEKLVSRAVREGFRDKNVASTLNVLREGGLDTTYVRF